MAESVNTVWEYNGVSLTLDLQDADQAAALEAANEQIVLDEQEAQKEEKLSALMLAECRMYRRFFDAVFGEGAAGRLFGEKNHRGRMLDAFESFVEFGYRQRDEIVRETSERLSRFSPNRAQRRAK